MLPLKFNFSAHLIAPAIPVTINKQWIDTRRAELKECFDQLNSRIKQIDSSTLQGMGDLSTAAYLAKYYNNYRIDMNNVIRGYYAVIDLEQSAPAYTAKNKGRIG